MRKMEMNSDDLDTKHRLGILGSNINHITEIYQLYHRIMVVGYHS